MGNSITIHDLNFRPYLSYEKIKDRISELTRRIDEEKDSQNLTLVSVLKGAVPFSTYLHQDLHERTKIAYVWASSYEDLQSTGNVIFKGLDRLNLDNQHVIIVEDIVDSGLTVHRLSTELNRLYKLESLDVAALLYKPDKDQYQIQPRYVGFEIPPDFVLGFGMDYKDQGRGLKDIYVLDK